MQNALSGRTNVSSVSEIMTKRAVFLSPNVSSSKSSVSISSRSSLMSNGANLAPQLISMLLAVLPVTFCKGLFNQIHKKFTFQGKKIEPGTCFLDSRLYNSAYALLSAFSCLTSSRESPEILTISSKAYLPAANIRSATSFIPSFNV